ncbi:MAG: CHAT domain-containing protein [Pyrinomonadaceae bacterium]
MLKKGLVLGALFCVCLINVFAQDERKNEAERIFAEAETLRKSNRAEDRRLAIGKYEETIPIFNQLEMADREAEAFNNIGYLYAGLGEFEKSLSNLEKSLTISRRVENQKLQIVAMLNQTRSLRALGRNPEAIERVKEALEISRAIGDREKEAAALNNLGVTFFADGKIQESLEHFQSAAAIFGDLGKSGPQASLLNNLGLINRLLGNQEEAVEQYLKALEIFRREKNLAGEADVSINLSAAYTDSFQTAEAMESFERALSIFRQMGNRQREAVVHNNIGVFYNNLGDYPRAKDHYLRSAEIARDIGDRRNYASALKNLGILYLNLNEPDKALEDLSRGLELSREVKNKIDEGWILNNLGLVHDKKGESEKAIGFMEQSLEILREVGNREGEAHTLNSLGWVLYRAGEKEKALESYNASLEINRDLIKPSEEAKVLLGIARIERDLGNREAARTAIEQSIEQIEALRTGIPMQDLRSSYFSLSKDSYDFYIDLLLGNGDGPPPPENVVHAFEISEQTRARSLLETLIESRTEIRRGVDPELLKRERALQHRLNAREQYRMRLLRNKSKPELIETIEKDLRSLIDEYEQVRARIRTRSPAYAALVQPRPMSLREIRQEVLDPDTVLLEYSLGEKNSYLWTVTKDSIASHTLPESSEIEAVTRRFYRALNARNIFSPNETADQRTKRIALADSELAGAAEALSRMIIPGDIAEFGQKRLLIVADGVLQYIPFGALRVPAGKSRKARFLIETNEIINLPSASALAVLRKTRRVKRAEPKELIAVLADPVFSTDDVRVKIMAGKSKTRPDGANNLQVQAGLLPPRLRSDFSRLRFSRREAEMIARLVPDERKFVALDFAANMDSIHNQKFNGARIIHLATHGIVNSELPELSGVVLSLVDENGQTRDGFLRLHDIYNLQLEADLVVLSACETALGKEIRGEGIVGLTRGFMYAGASDVVASLWKVDDRATADLMKRFYQYLLKENRTPADALRQAQISMLKESPTSNPYHWAAFTLQGDWK